MVFSNHPRGYLLGKIMTKHNMYNDERELNIVRMLVPVRSQLLFMLYLKGH
jgi:hypothetical protein